MSEGALAGSAALDVAVAESLVSAILYSGGQGGCSTVLRY